MGKQAKKKVKSETQAKGQRRHNPKTRGVNSSRQGALWAVRSYKAKEDGVEVERTYEVRVPHNCQWDPWDPQRNHENASEPFDSLRLNWAKEIQHYAVDNKGKVLRRTLPNGRYLYRIVSGTEILLEIESSRSAFQQPRRRRRRKG